MAIDVGKELQKRWRALHPPQTPSHSSCERRMLQQLIQVVSGIKTHYIEASFRGNAVPPDLKEFLNTASRDQAPGRMWGRVCRYRQLRANILKHKPVVGEWLDQHITEIFDNYLSHFECKQDVLTVVSKIDTWEERLSDLKCQLNQAEEQIKATPKELQGRLEYAKCVAKAQKLQRLSHQAFMELNRHKETLQGYLRRFQITYIPMG